MTNLTYDNRDCNTTTINNAIDVDPVDLMGNMIENCYNDDMLFLFNMFVQFMNQDLEYHMDIEQDIHETREDYIVKFRDYLTSLIESNRAPEPSEPPSKLVAITVDGRTTHLLDYQRWALRQACAIEQHRCLRRRDNTKTKWAKEQIMQQALFLERLYKELS